MASETLSRGALPRIQWSPVITGVLCAIAVHVVLGLFGAAFGFAADPADSTGMGVAAVLWALVVPLVASFIGAFICVRIARAADEAEAYLHGGLVWCLGLIAGAIFIAGSLATSAMSTATATSGNLRGGISRPDATLGGRSARTEARMEDAQKNAATAAGAGGLGALLGLAGAFLGAAAGRQALTGRGLGLRGASMRRRPAPPAPEDRYGREERMRPEGTGVVSSTRMPEVTRPPAGEMPRPGEDPTTHH